MADNVPVTAGSGTNIATDDVAGVHYVRHKVDLGGDGVASPLVRGQLTKANSVPVTLASDEDIAAILADILTALGAPVDVNVTGGSAAGTEYTEDEVVIAVDAPGLLWRDDSDGHMEPVGSDTPMPVEVVAGATSATEYTEGATDSTITGSVPMWEDTGDTLRAPSVAKPFPVQVVTSPGGSVLPDPIVDASAVAAPLKFASVNATADGDNTIVALVSGKKIRVVSYGLFFTAAGTMQVKSGGSTVKGRMISAANGAGAEYAGGVDAPAFETAAGEALVFNNTAAMDTLGHVTYFEGA